MAVWKVRPSGGVRCGHVMGILPVRSRHAGGVLRHGVAAAHAASWVASGAGWWSVDVALEVFGGDEQVKVVNRGLQEVTVVEVEALGLFVAVVNEHCGRADHAT